MGLGLIHPTLGFAEPQEIKIGVLAKRGPAVLVQEWQPTAEYRSAAIADYNFNIVSLDFAEIHDAVRAGQVDFILTNPALYAELEKLHGIRRIITLINQNVPGQPAMLMGGVILTRANRTDIDRLAALRGRSFMAVDPLLSAAGIWPGGS